MCFDVSGRNIRVIFLRKFTLFFRRIIIYLLVWMTHISYIKGEKKKIKLLKWVFFLPKKPILHMDDPDTYFCLFFSKGTATKHMSEWSDGF